MGKVVMRYPNWRLRFIGDLSSEFSFEKGIQIHFSQRNFATLDFQSRGCRPSLYWVCRDLTFGDRCMPIALFCLYTQLDVIEIR
jgi:hypothetical protein